MVFLFVYFMIMLDDSDLEDDSFQNNINEPWNQTDKYTRLRRNYAPLNFTAYDERLIMSKLNALLYFLCISFYVWKIRCGRF